MPGLQEGRAAQTLRLHSSPVEDPFALHCIALHRHPGSAGATSQSLLWPSAGKVHRRNTLEQLKLVGPRSLGVALLTASFVGMVFTIQFVREFAKLGLTRSVGGVLALALSRELTPVVTCIILAGELCSPACRAAMQDAGSCPPGSQQHVALLLAGEPWRLHSWANHALHQPARCALPAGLVQACGCTTRLHSDDQELHAGLLPRALFRL